MYICLDKMKMSDVKSCIYKTEACVTDHMGNINKLLTNHSMPLTNGSFISIYELPVFWKSQVPG